MIAWTADLIVPSVPATSSYMNTVLSFTSPITLSTSVLSSPVLALYAIANSIGRLYVFSTIVLTLSTLFVPPTSGLAMVEFSIFCWVIVFAV